MDRKILVTIIICTLSLSNCRKSADEHQVPNVTVNRTISTNLPQYNDLNFVGGWVYLNGGYNGLLLYRSTPEEVKAYDRQAPYQISKGCRVRVDAGGVSCTDTCSGSAWLLYDGQVLNGPAFNSLKAYNVSFDGSNVSINN